MTIFSVANDTVFGRKERGTSGREAIETVNNGNYPLIEIILIEIAKCSLKNATKSIF